MDVETVPGCVETCCCCKDDADCCGVVGGVEVDVDLSFDLAVGCVDDADCFAADGGE